MVDGRGGRLIGFDFERLEIFGSDSVPLVTAERPSIEGNQD
jgi:hypothetical protein